MPARRNGTIAHLPNALRNRVNLMLLDGVTYPGIIKRLGRKGVGLKKDHLSEWFKGGYKDWLAENRRLERMRTIRDFSMRVVKANEGNKIQEAALHIAATHIYELLSEFDPSTLQETFKGDPEDYARIIRALFQISGGGLKHEQYRAEVAERKAQLEKQLAAVKAGGLTDDAIAELERTLKLL